MARQNRTRPKKNHTNQRDGSEKYWEFATVKFAA